MSDLGGADFGGDHKAVVGVEHQTALWGLDGELLDRDSWVGHLLKFLVGGRQLQVHTRVLLPLAINLQ